MSAVVLPRRGTVGVARSDDPAPAPDGTTGLILCSLAVNRAVGAVSVVDPNPARPAGATAAGADHVALGAEELDRPEGREIVIDATGSPPAQEDAQRHIRRGGTFLVFGVADKDAMASFSPFRVYDDELTIIGRRRSSPPANAGAMSWPPRSSTAAPRSPTA